MKRILLSLWCGFTIPFLYLFLLAAISSVLDKQISGEIGWTLFLPLRLPEMAYSSLYQPQINSASEVLSEGVHLSIVIIFGNIFIYAAISYFVIWLLSIFNKPRNERNYLKLAK